MANANLSFDFSELFALKKLALQLIDEVQFYKMTSEKNDAIVKQLLREKLEMHLQLEATSGGTSQSCMQSEPSSDQEKALLLKNISVLEDANKELKNQILELQSQFQTVKRELKNSEFRRFQAETQLDEAKSRFELESNARKEVHEHIASASRMLMELRNNQKKLESNVDTNNKEVREACALYRRFEIQNKFLQEALTKAEETISDLRNQSSVGINVSLLPQATITPLSGDEFAKELIENLEAKMKKSEDDIAVERRKNVELLESLTKLTAVNGQLANDHQTMEASLKRQLEACSKESRALKSSLTKESAMDSQELE